MLSSFPHFVPMTVRLPADQVGGGGGEGGGDGEVSVSVFKWGQTEERQGHLVLTFLIIITPHLVSSDVELWGEPCKISTTSRRS